MHKSIKFMINRIILKQLFCTQKLTLLKYITKISYIMTTIVKKYISLILLLIIQDNAFNHNRIFY